MALPIVESPGIEEYPDERISQRSMRSTRPHGGARPSLDNAFPDPTLGSITDLDYPEALTGQFYSRLLRTNRYLLLRYGEGSVFPTALQLAIDSSHEQTASTPY
ncbi:hypothetical protein PVAR5_7464 [Paecilomyces variotii No. 5]|uniref:Uncharacterized protein n=1 Tax=Byssochlamys spectabilis (strain No. 5 / NBRC 109023) TaxID=1356009 RepID=V5G2X8_BYSSN|nr:hypothetical protein PVAR5_7464 [Paecilomyces variotii No. 5]